MVEEKGIFFIEKQGSLSYILFLNPNPNILAKRDKMGQNSFLGLTDNTTG